MPKPNMYQSLHTTLIGPEGHPFEIQIRTFEMHRVAEYGIAAHWKYKENNNTKGLNKEEEKLSWLREVLEWQRDWAQRGTYDAVMDIVREHSGAYGMGVDYAYTMVHKAPSRQKSEHRTLAPVPAR